MKSAKTLLRLALAGWLFTSMPAFAHANESPSPDADRDAVAPVSQMPAEVKAALACLDAYLEAFNNRDDTAYDATFNFPSYRLAAGQFSTHQPGEVKFSMFAASNPDWDYSRWAKREVIQSGPDKVHIAATLARYRMDGTLVKTFDSLYVITRQDGHWGIKIRSSYAPM